MKKRERIFYTKKVLYCIWYRYWTKNLQDSIIGPTEILCLHFSEALTIWQREKPLKKRRTVCEKNELFWQKRGGCFIGAADLLGVGLQPPRRGRDN
jgi:hypothetical protein